MRYREETPSFQIQFIWSPNAFKGYGAAMVFLSIVMLVSMCTKVEPPDPYPLPKSTPVTLLIFGEGDGTGARKGNLTAEGKALKGQDAQNPLQDAQKAASARSGKATSDPTQATNLKPVADVGSRGKPDQTADAADRTIGSSSGSDDGTGIGWAGSGKGKGLGYGDIDWGGGGNRIVLNKVMPTFPSGVRNTEVKLKFRVRPDGSVSFVLPVRRGGDPAADQAAINAMKRWRFNKLNNDQEMEGTITFVFRGS